MNYKWTGYIIFLITGILLCRIPANAQELFGITAKCIEGQKTVIEITVDDDIQVDGFDIYRADQADESYQYIGNIDAATEDDWEDYYYNNADYTFTDSAVLAIYQTYYYRVQAYQNINGIKTYIQSADASVLIVGTGPVMTYGKRSSKFNAGLKWKKSADADGYLIYCVKDYDENGNYIGTDIYGESRYTLVRKISGNSTNSTTFKNLKNGVTYTYRICSYKNINGMQVSSLFSEAKSITMDYYAYETESYYQKIKRAFGSEKAKKKNFKTQKKARKQMSTIKIKVWDFKNGKKGKKITRTKYVTVNKRLAPTVKQIFKEIYESREKQVIHDIGCYSYRKGEHMYGMAIDVNANENYMIDGKKVLAGRYWKPKKDPYSIPNNSEFVKIMRRYGFSRGEWGRRKDYMHFSYFGE